MPALLRQAADAPSDGALKMTAILDINDATLSLWRDGEMLLHSPGYALLDGRNYRFGEAARGLARLHPQKVNHRFWSQLDVTPLTPAFGPSRHSADLVHSHLLNIGAQADIDTGLLLAAPGGLQHEQLSLLLGIIEQCPFNAAGLVDRAIAAMSVTGAATYNWHVDLQLHQALVTGARFADGELQRDQVIPIPGCGWLALQESLAKTIADTFIRQTRFDPRRKAATEQALYDQLPALLEQLAHSPEHSLELGGHQARVERSLLAEQCAGHYQRIASAVSTAQGRLLLGHTLGALPGILDALPGAEVLLPDAVAAGMATNRERVSSGEEGLHFVTRLPAETSANATLFAPKSVQGAEPSAPARCQIECEDGAWSLRHLSGAAPRLNGDSVTDTQPLHANDIIELEDGSRWHLVQVGGEESENHGA